MEHINDIIENPVVSLILFYGILSFLLLFIIVLVKFTIIKIESKQSFYEMFQNFNIGFGINITILILITFILWPISACEIINEYDQLGSQEPYYEVCRDRVLSKSSITQSDLREYNQLKTSIERLKMAVIGDKLMTFVIIPLTLIVLYYVRFRSNLKKKINAA
jgi:hypothetical protein